MPSGKFSTVSPISQDSMGAPFTSMRTASISGRKEHTVNATDPASSQMSSPEKAR